MKRKRDGPPPKRHHHHKMQNRGRGNRGRGQHYHENQPGRGGRGGHQYHAMYRPKDRGNAEGLEDSRKRPKKVLRKERYPFFKKRRDSQDREEGGDRGKPSPYPYPPRGGKRKDRRERGGHRGGKYEGPRHGDGERGEEVSVVSEENSQDMTEGIEGKLYNYGDRFQFDEDREHEFKSITKAVNPIDRISLFCDDYVNAFLNTDGGYIYFGIEDDGTIVGLPLNRKERDTLRLRVDGYISNFKPQVDPYLFRMTFSKVAVHEEDKVLRPALPHAASGKKPRRHDRYARQLSKTNPNTRNTPAQYRVKQQPFLSHSGKPDPAEHRGTPPEHNDTPLPPHHDGDEDDDDDVSDEAEGELIEEGTKAEDDDEDYEDDDEEEEEEEEEHGAIHQEAITNPPHGEAAHSEKQKEGERPIKGYRYLVEVAVGRGRAPVYFNCHGNAFFRLSGSIHMMKESMVEERKLMGRPPLAASPSTSHVGTLSPKPLAAPTAISPRPASGASNAGPADFIGREKDVNQVKEFIFQTPHEGNNVTILLYGSPVVGKSALARHLVHELSSVYNGAHYTINMKGVSTSYISNLDAMISVIRNAYPMRILPESESEICGIYQSCFNNSKCILLIENAGNVEQIQALIPKTSTERSVVLVTSRRDMALDVVIEDTLSIRLSALEPDDAVLLVQALVPNISIGQAKEISELCAYLPLPIRLVGSTIRRKPNINVDSVIKRLKSDSNQFLELLENMMGVSAEEMYPEQVKDYMFMLSIFPSGFDGPAAQAILKKGYEETVDILGLLIEYSLIDFRLATGRYQMNDLVRLYCSKKLEEKEKTRTANTATKEKGGGAKEGGEAAGAEEPSIKEIQTRFISYYLTMLEELISLKCAGSKSGNQEDMSACMLCFVRERKNFEVGIKYAMVLKEYRLAWQLSKNMMLFVKDLNNLENQKWKSVVDPVVASESVKEVSKKEKEDEKNNRNSSSSAEDTEKKSEGGAALSGEQHSSSEKL